MKEHISRQLIDPAMARQIEEMEERERRSGYTNALLNIALNQSSDAVFLIDYTLRFVFVNEAACRSLGYSCDELLTMTSPDIDPDVTKEMADGMMAELFEAGRQETFRTRHRTKDGRIFPVEISVTMFEHQGDKFSLCLARDITERKRMEEALVAREREFRSLADNLPDNIARWDSQGRYLYVNPTHERTLGVSAHDIIGMEIPDTHTNVKTAIAQIVATGQPVQVEQRALVNGRLEIHIVSLAPEFDADGRVASVLGIGRDMTNIYRMQDELAARERGFRTLAENLPDNIARYDTNCRVSYYNPRLCRILRLSASPSGKTPMELHPGGEYREYQNLLERVLATGEEIELDIDDVDAEGGKIVHNVRLVAERDNGGEITGVLAIGRDITERKRMEDELHRKNGELERFTYTVSHDLKSPLVTIKSFTGAMKQDLASGRHDRLEKDLGRIGGAADKMAALLDDLLKLSRVGRVMGAPEPVDMATLVDDVLNSMAGTLKETGVQVTVQPGLPTVSCDRQRMMEVLQNLIENGVKYRGNQPEPRIVIGVREDEGRQVFFVQDNGPGIDPKYHDNIFGLFNRLDTQVPGTGIGLALVKRIIETHGGSIRVESDGQGNGSTFCFTVGETLPPPSPLLKYRRGS